MQDFYDYMFDSWDPSCHPMICVPNMDEFSNKQILELAHDVGYNLAILLRETGADKTKRTVRLRKY